MARIPVTELKAGMVLAEPVKRKDGMVLFAAGTTLSEEGAKRLAALGLDSVNVSGEGPDEGLAQLFRERDARLDRLFRAHTDSAWMMKIKERLRSYFQKRAAQAEKG